MNKKIIFLDIDGTLIDWSKNLRPEVVSAIKEAQRNGHKVFLATGRAYHHVADEIMDIGFDGGIFSAGNYVLIGDRVLLDTPLPSPLLAKLSKKLDENLLLYNYECRDKAYSSYTDLDFLKGHEEELSSEVARRIQKESKIETSSLNTRDYQGEPVYKILFLGLDRQSVERFRDEVGEEANVTLFDNPPGGMKISGGEVSIPGVNKGTALKAVCKELQIPMSDSLAFGDSNNDIELIEAAGTGIAMANACEALKAVADDTAPDVKEAGVAKKFKSLGLIEKD